MVMTVMIIITTWFPNIPDNIGIS